MSTATQITDAGVRHHTLPPVDVPYSTVVSDDVTVGYVIDSGEHEGTYYLISPSENADDEWKYEADSCSDIADAWGLRNSGHFGDDVDLEARIKRRANDLDCSGMPWEDAQTNADEDADMVTCDCNDCNTSDTMSDDTSGTDFPVQSLSVDAVRSKNESVDERLAELETERDVAQDAVETMQSVREALSVDDDDSVSDAIESLQTDVNDLTDELNNYREQERSAMRESIVDASEYEMDDLSEMAIDELETVADAVNHASGGTDGDDDSDGDGDDSSVKAPVNDFHDDGDSGSGEVAFDDINYERQI